MNYSNRNSKSDGTKKDCIKGNKCNEIDSKSRNKYGLELQETCKDTGKDSPQRTNSRNKTETSRDNFNRTNRRLPNQNNAKGESKEEDKMKMNKNN